MNTNGSTSNSTYTPPGTSCISIINSYCQKLKLKPPSYEIHKEGEDHKPWFKAICTFGEHNTRGEGLTLKSAKEGAASQLVDLLGIRLKDLKENNSYTIILCSSLADIWNNSKQECILTIKKKENNKCEYKTFKVLITHINK